MLQRTFAIWQKVNIDAKASGSHTPGQQPADMALAQLGINYRWSDIVLDERDALSKDQLTNPYGKDGDSLHAGDRAPDAPQLKDINAGDTTTSLFQILSPKQHSALIFTDDNTQLGPVFDALGGYPLGTVSSVIILPRVSATSSRVDGNQGARILRDADGHAHGIYGVPDRETTIFMIRPDDYIGAIVSGADGLVRYRKLVFN